MGDFPLLIRGIVSYYYSKHPGIPDRKESRRGAVIQGTSSSGRWRSSTIPLPRLTGATPPHSDSPYSPALVWDRDGRVGKGDERERKHTDAHTRQWYQAQQLPSCGRATTTQPLNLWSSLIPSPTPSPPLPRASPSPSAPRGSGPGVASPLPLRLATGRDSGHREWNVEPDAWEPTLLRLSWQR